MTKDEKHYLIQSVIQLAQENGRTPKRYEVESEIPGSKYKIQKYFGNYDVLLQAAGLDPANKKIKITNEIFNRKIDNHLEQYRAEPQFGPMTQPARILTPYTAAIISDIHWPFSNEKVINRFIEYVGDEKPDHVIINGDAWDFYSHTKFPRSHNQFTPREEQDSARSSNVEFWERVQKASPKSKRTQMLGNHDIRPMKRIMESYPEAEDWVKQKIQELFTFDGVKTIFDPREEFFLNENTVVFHGYRSQLGSHRDFTLYNCINGHTHKGGVVQRLVRGELLFELNSGLAGDPCAKGLTYTPQKITNWTPGFGAISKWGPMFVGVP